MKALLLCNYDVFGAAMVTEHINAIIEYSSMDVFVYNELVPNRGELDFVFDLNEFDVIIVHYSIFLAVDNYCSTRTKAKLKAARGLKVAFLQDEYRFVDRSIEAMHEAGIGLVFSCVPTPSIPLVYPPEKMKNIRVVNTLTGYASSFLAALKPTELKERKFDVSYRGRRYPDWHGSMGREKYEIAEQFRRHARGKRLKLNISCDEKDRVYGLRWVELMQNSRAVLGVESGASVFDFSGEVSSRTETKRNLLGRKGISYEDLRKESFADMEDRIDLAQISPRVLEAICLRTACILFEGSYSGLLSPNTHYIPLKKDFSNFDEVVKRLKDERYLAEVISNAYVDIAVNPKHSYKAFVASMDAEIRNEKIPEKEKIKAPVSTKSSKPGQKRPAASDEDLHDEDEDSLDDRYTFGMSREQKQNLRFRRLYNKTYPFSVYPYPHGVVSGIDPAMSIIRKLYNFAKRVVPRGILARIKAVIR